MAIILARSADYFLHAMPKPALGAKQSPFPGKSFCAFGDKGDMRVVQ